MLKKIISSALCLMVFLLSLCACADQSQKATENQKVESSNNDKTSTQVQDNISNDATDSTIFDTLSSLSEWQRAYLDFLNTRKDEHYTYALVYIDNDDIPELYMSGLSEATGDGVCSLKHGSIVEQRLGRIGGGSYIEKGGMLANQNGNMGACYTDVYKLTHDGFTQTFSAYSVEKIDTMENGDLKLSYEYSVEGKRVDQLNYETAVNNAFNFTKSIRLNQNAVSYEEILQQIQNYK